jgi:hypothetical protein
MLPDRFPLCLDPNIRHCGHGNVSWGHNLSQFNTFLLLMSDHIQALYETTGTNYSFLNRFVSEEVRNTFFSVTYFEKNKSFNDGCWKFFHIQETARWGEHIVVVHMVLLTHTMTCTVLLTSYFPTTARPTRSDTGMYQTMRDLYIKRKTWCRFCRSVKRDTNFELGIFAEQRVTWNE